MKKTMWKKGFIIVLAFVSILTLCACGQIKPEKAAVSALDAVKTGDAGKINVYMNYDELAGGLDAATLKAIFTNLSYKIVSAETKNDTATVKADITNTDLEKALTKYLAQAAAFMTNPVDASGKTLSDEEATAKVRQMLIDILAAKDNETLTTSVEMHLVKAEKSWQVNIDENLIKALMGGSLALTAYTADSTGQNTGQ